MRILVLIAAIVAAFWIVRYLLTGRRDRPRGAHGQPTRPGATAPAHGESLVRCARCGVLCPESHAIRRAGATFCSAEHARLGPPRESDTANATQTSPSNGHAHDD